MYMCFIFHWLLEMTLIAIIDTVCIIVRKSLSWYIISSKVNIL